MHIKKEVADLRRFKQIVNVLFKYEFGHLVHGLNLKHLLPFHKQAQKHKFKKKVSNPKKIRLAFEELGGAFIKLGQMLSLRPDLIPKVYADELSNLQDNVKPFPFSQVKKIIEKEFQKPIKDVFKSFDQKPIAAASIGQVHAAKLKSGQKVAVKIRRPGISKKFFTDIHLLFYFAKLIKKHYPQPFVDPMEIVKQFQKYTIKELDYIKEAKNITVFYENFRNDSTVKIPKVYKDYTSKNIITMELIQGTKLSEIKEFKRYNTKKISKNLVLCTFKQVFIDGFFHADPHPANVFVLKNNNIALIDFGIIGYLDEQLKEDAADLFVALIKGDVNLVAESLLNLGFINGVVNMSQLKEDLVNHLSEYRGTSLRHLDFSTLFHNLINVAKENHIVLPVNFILLCKAVITVEGTCSMLDPDFNLLDTAQPFVKKLKKERLKAKYIIHKSHSYAHKLLKFISRLPEKAEEIYMELKDADQTIKSIDKDIRNLTVEISRTTTNLVFGGIVMALVIAAALVMPYDSRKIFGMPLFAFMYISMAGMLLAYLFITSLHRKKLRR